MATSRRRHGDTLDAGDAGDAGDALVPRATLAK